MSKVQAEIGKLSTCDEERRFLTWGLPLIRVLSGPMPIGHGLGIPKDKVLLLWDFKGHASVKTAAFRVFSKHKSALSVHPSFSPPLRFLDPWALLMHKHAWILAKRPREVNQWLSGCVLQGQQGELWLPVFSCSDPVSQSCGFCW